MKVLTINDLLHLFDLESFEKLNKISKNKQDEILIIENELIDQYRYVCYKLDNCFKQNRALSLFLLHSSIPYFFIEDRNNENILYSIWPDILNCRRCKSIVKRPTIYAGNLNPTYLFVGEAPGVGDGIKYTYDRVLVYGPTSHLLRNILFKLGIYLESGFTNLLKDSLPFNRKGNLEEYDNCYPYLLNEISVLKPKKIILMGSNIFNYLKNKFSSYEYAVIPHPSYFVRNNNHDELFNVIKEKLCI